MNALDRLRQAAQERDLTSSQAALLEALTEIDYFYGLGVALQLAQAHLPVFEAAHPDDGWARSLLVWLGSYGAPPANLPVEAGQPHASPGAGNFVHALIELTRSAERRTPLENRLRFLANAMTNLILADLAADWYGQHPELWTLQQEAGDEIDDETGQPLRQTIYAHFWLDETVAARDTAAWLELADVLEAQQRR